MSFPDKSIRPDGVTDEMLEYLDVLRAGGTVNMFWAAPHLMQEFGIASKTADTALLYWIRTFTERHTHRSEA